MNGPETVGTDAAASASAVEGGAGRPPGHRLLAVADYGVTLIAGTTLFAMMLMTFADVVGRYVLGRPLGFSFEVTQLAMAIVVLAALPSVTLRGMHITVGLFEDRFGVVAAKVRDLVIAFAIATSCLYLAWRLSTLAGRFVSYGEVTSVLRLPIGYVAWFGVATLVLAAVLLLVATVLDLSGTRSTAR